jgi:hypothetical protein
MSVVDPDMMDQSAPKAGEPRGSPGGPHAHVGASRPLQVIVPPRRNGGCPMKSCYRSSETQSRRTRTPVAPETEGGRGADDAGTREWALGTQTGCYYPNVGLERGWRHGEAVSSDGTRVAKRRCETSVSGRHATRSKRRRGGLSRPACRFISSVFEWCGLLSVAFSAVSAGRRRRDADRWRCRRSAQISGLPEGTNAGSMPDLPAVAVEACG